MKCDDDRDRTRWKLIDQSHGQIDWLKLITCQGHMTWIDWYVTFDWHCKNATGSRSIDNNNTDRHSQYYQNGWWCHDLTLKASTMSEIGWHKW